MKEIRKNPRKSRLTNIAACFMIILTFCMATSSVHVYGATDVATVSGRVVDEDGKGIEDVKIEIYSSGGTLITSTNTSSDGSFIYQSVVTFVKRVLHFSKEGYVDVIKSVLLFRGGTVDLDEIVLPKSVRLHSSILSLIANPGDKLLLPFAVNNIGEESETVEFSISDLEGWSTRILDQAGREIVKVELSSGSSLNLQLEVTIPLSSAGENNLTLTAAGKVNSTLNFMIKVQPSSKSIIYCQFPGKLAAPGEIVRFQLRLKNPFGVETRFKISVDSIPSGWSASVKSASGEYVTDVTLGSNEFVNIVVEVESPDSAKIGEEYTLSVKVESHDGNLADSLQLSIALNEVAEGISITTKFPEVTVEAGKIVQYPIAIINSGDADKLLLLTVEPPADWKAVFKSGMLEVSRLYLEAGRAENLVIEVTPPSTVDIGSYTIPVQVKSENDVTYAEIELKAAIIGSYKLSLEPSTLLTSVATGSSTMFTAKITNTGHTAVTGVGLEIGAPEDWELTVTPIQAEILRPRESSTFTVVLKIPEDTVAGDYLIALTGLSDQVESDQIEVRVTVTTPTSWVLYGVGVAVVMVILLVLVFLKFKRR